MHNLGSTEKRRSIPLVKQFSGINSVLSSVDEAFQHLCELKQLDDARLKVDADTPVDPELRGVKFKAAARTFHEPFGRARDYLEQSLKDRSNIQEDDVKKVAHVQAVLEQAMVALPPHSGTKDDRLQRCDDACKQFVSVLNDAGWGEKFRIAKEEAVEMARQVYISPTPAATPVAVAEEAELPRVVSYPTPVAVAEGAELPRVISATSDSGYLLVPQEAAFPRLVSNAVPRLDGGQRHTLLSEIDDARDVNEMMPKIYNLFRQYSDKYHQIQGDQLVCLVDELATYVKEEWNARNARFEAEGKRRLPDHTDDFLKSWVLASVDADGDRCITENEAYVGFKKVVDEID